MSQVKSVSFAILGLFAVVGVLAAVKFDQIKMMIDSGESFVPPPETISVFKAEQQSWPNVYVAIGTVEADEGIMISAQVPGKVKRYYFPIGR